MKYLMIFTEDYSKYIKIKFDTCKNIAAFALAAKIL